MFQFNCAEKDMKSLKNEKLLMEQELRQVQEEKTAILKVMLMNSTSMVLLFL